MTTKQQSPYILQKYPTVRVIDFPIRKHGHVKAPLTVTRNFHLVLKNTHNMMDSSTELGVINLAGSYEYSYPE